MQEEHPINLMCGTSSDNSGIMGLEGWRRSPAKRHWGKPSVLSLFVHGVVAAIPEAAAPHAAHVLSPVAGLDAVHRAILEQEVTAFLVDRVEAGISCTAKHDGTNGVGDAVHIHVNAQAPRATVDGVVDCGARASLAAVGAAVGLGVSGNKDSRIDFFDEGRAIEAAGLAVAEPLMRRSVIAHN